MAKIEDIVYRAIDLNLHEELFKEVSRLRFKNDKKKQLSEIYEDAFDNIKPKYESLVQINDVYEEEEEENYGFGDHSITQF